MTEKLISGLGSGLEIEVNTASTILLEFIKNGWPATVEVNPNPILPLKASVDFGATPDRTSKGVTLTTYVIFSNIYNSDVGSRVFGFDIPVAIDIFVRDITAASKRIEPPVLVAIETYLRDYITTNRLALRNKGINNMNVSSVEAIPEPPSDENDVTWFHMVVTVRMYYHMTRATV
jgi:hypothetical protein